MLRTPSYAIAFDDEADWVLYVRHSLRDDIAYRITMRQASGHNIHTIYSIEEGYARAAWYPAFTPDAQSGAMNYTASALYNQNYWRFNDASDTSDWTAPSTAEGVDTLVFTFVGLVGGGSFKVIKNPAAEATDLGTISTNNGSTVWRKEETLAVSALVAGDVIRIAWVSGDARVCGFRGYASSGSPASGDQPIEITDAQAVHKVGSSVEFAYAMAPAGETPKFVGGHAHQGGSYGIEVSPSESWTKDGSPWTPDVGFVSGVMVLSRTTVAYFDAGSPDIAAISCSYTLAHDRFSVGHVVTADVELDTSALYCAMMAPPPSISYVEALPARELIDVTVDDGGEEDVSSDALQVTKRLRAMWSPLAQSLVLDIERITEPLSRLWAWKVAGQYDKLYAQVALGSGVPAGKAWGASWRWSADSGYGGQRNTAEAFNRG